MALYERVGHCVQMLHEAATRCNCCSQCCWNRTRFYSCSIACNIVHNNFRGGHSAISHAGCNIAHNVASSYVRTLTLWNHDTIAIYSTYNLIQSKIHSPVEVVVIYSREGEILAFNSRTRRAFHSWIITSCSSLKTQKIQKIGTDIV